MNRYWISWYQPTEDYRPLTDPPHESVLGWWCSGYRCSDGLASLCALVSATDEESAKACVRHSWPEAAEWRFCEERDSDWLPGDRFPLSTWMQLRLALHAAKETP